MIILFFAFISLFFPDGGFQRLRIRDLPALVKNEAVLVSEMTMNPTSLLWAPGILWHSRVQLLHQMILFWMDLRMSIQVSQSRYVMLLILAHILTFPFPFPFCD
jgi:hypothetical protein